MKHKVYEKEKIIAVLNHKAKKNNWGKIGVLSSLKKNYECIQHVADELVESNSEIDFIKIISLDLKDEIGKLLKCDAVVFVEKYAYTTYGNFEKLVELMENLDITVQLLICMIGQLSPH